MVLNYYKLAEQPFGVTPDPRFLYSSPTHREAVASVLCGGAGAARIYGADCRAGHGQDHVAV